MDVKKTYPTFKKTLNPQDLQSPILLKPKQTTNLLFRQEAVDTSILYFPVEQAKKLPCSGDVSWLLTVGNTSWKIIFSVVWNKIPSEIVIKISTS